MAKQEHVDKLMNNIVSLGSLLNLNQSKDSGRKEEMSVFSKRIAEKQQLRQSAKIGMDFNVSDEDGNKIVLSSNSKEIKAFYKDKPVNWNPPVLSSEELDKMSSEEGLILVANDLLNQFKSYRTSAVHAVTPNTVQENQLESKRKGFDNDVKESLLEDYRTGNPEDVQEKQLQSKRTGNPEDVQEAQLSNAGLYSRKFNSSFDDVKEALLEDVRTGHPVDVIENILESRRSEKTTANPQEVVASTISALARTVVALKITPDEVINEVNNMDFNRLSDHITLSQLGNNHRRTLAKRNNFHNSPVHLTITASLFDELGKINDVNSNDIVEVLRLASTDKENFNRAIAKRISQEKSELNNVNRVVTTNTKQDIYKSTLATFASDDKELGVDQLKVVLSALGYSTKELKATPEQVLASLENVDENVLTMDVQLARIENNVDTRIAERERRQYWNTKIASSTDTDIYNNAVGWLADFANPTDTSTTMVVKTVKELLRKPKAAVSLINSFIKKSMQLTEEKTSTRRFVCRVDEIGIDVKSPDFEEQFRDKAIDILSQEGYEVDRNTFAITDLNVSESGEITASITTRFSKTFSVSPSSVVKPDYATEESSITDDVTPESSVNMEEPMMTPQSTLTNNEDMVNLEEPIMTASASKYRYEKSKMLEKYAQMPGMGGGTGAGIGGLTPPAGTGMGEPMGNNPMGASNSPISGLTTDSENGLGLGEEGEPNTDEESMTGDKKPWGTICPQCGSNKVDVANGEGNCPSCGAQLEFSFVVHVKPSNDTSKAQGSDNNGLDTLAPGGSENEPSPANQNANVPNNAGILAQASWVASPDIFVKVASEGDSFNRSKSLKLPLGYVCPSCGNREAEKVKDTTYCVDCGTISKTKITACKTDNTKFVASIIWM